MQLSSSLSLFSFCIDLLILSFARKSPWCARTGYNLPNILQWNQQVPSLNRDLSSPQINNNEAHDFVRLGNFQSSFVHALSGGTHDPDLSYLKSGIWESGSKKIPSLTKQKIAELTKGRTLTHKIHDLSFFIQMQITRVVHRIICCLITK